MDGTEENPFTSLQDLQTEDPMASIKDLQITDPMAPLKTIQSSRHPDPKTERGKAVYEDWKVSAALAAAEARKYLDLSGDKGEAAQLSVVGKNMIETGVQSLAPMGITNVMMKAAGMGTLPTFVASNLAILGLSKLGKMVDDTYIKDRDIQAAAKDAMVNPPSIEEINKRVNEGGISAGNVLTGAAVSLPAINYISEGIRLAGAMKMLWDWGKPQVQGIQKTLSMPSSDPNDQGYMGTAKAIVSQMAENPLEALNGAVAAHSAVTAAGNVWNGMKPFTAPTATPEQVTAQYKLDTNRETDATEQSLAAKIADSLNIGRPPAIPSSPQATDPNWRWGRVGQGHSPNITGGDASTIYIEHPDHLSSFPVKGFNDAMQQLADPSLNLNFDTKVPRTTGNNSDALATRKAAIKLYFDDPADVDKALPILEQNIGKDSVLRTGKDIGGESGDLLAARAKVIAQNAGLASGPIDKDNQSIFGKMSQWLRDSVFGPGYQGLNNALVGKYNANFSSYLKMARDGEINKGNIDGANQIDRVLQQHQQITGEKVSTDQQISQALRESKVGELARQLDPNSEALTNTHRFLKDPTMMSALLPKEIEYVEGVQKIADIADAVNQKNVAGYKSQQNYAPQMIKDWFPKEILPSLDLNARNSIRIGVRHAMGMISDKMIPAPGPVKITEGYDPATKTFNDPARQAILDSVMKNKGDIIQGNMGVGDASFNSLVDKVVIKNLDSYLGFDKLPLQGEEAATYNQKSTPASFIPGSVKTKYIPTYGNAQETNGQKLVEAMVQHTHEVAAQPLKNFIADIAGIKTEDPDTGEVRLANPARADLGVNLFGAGEGTTMDRIRQGFDVLNKQYHYGFEDHPYEPTALSRAVDWAYGSKTSEAKAPNIAARQELFNNMASNLLTTPKFFVQLMMHPYAREGFKATSQADLEDRMIQTTQNIKNVITSQAGGVLGNFLKENIPLVGEGLGSLVEGFTANKLGDFVKQEAPTNQRPDLSTDSPQSSGQTDMNPLARMARAVGGFGTIPFAYERIARLWGWLANSVRIADPVGQQALFLNEMDRQLTQNSAPDVVDKMRQAGNGSITRGFLESGSLPSNFRDLISRAKTLQAQDQGSTQGELNKNPLAETVRRGLGKNSKLTAAFDMLGTFTHWSANNLLQMTKAMYELSQTATENSLRGASTIQQASDLMRTVAPLSSAIATGVGMGTLLSLISGKSVDKKEIGKEIGKTMAPIPGEFAKRAVGLATNLPSSPTSSIEGLANIFINPMITKPLSAIINNMAGK